MNLANLGPVDEGASVYGACRPGHLGGVVDDWAHLLDQAGVETVVCLLSEPEARRWGLPDAYEGTFRAHHVPIRDRHLPSTDRLVEAVDAIEASVVESGPAAVHCNAGQGRTGIVAAAWLVRQRGLPAERAVRVVSSGTAPRSPLEAIRDGNATKAELFDLLEGV